MRSPGVLEEQGDRPIVAVRAGPHLAQVNLKHVLPDLGVMEQTQGVVAHVGVCVKPRLVDAEADSDGPHDLHVQRLARVMKVDHRAAEADQLGESLLPLIRPMVRVARLALATDLEALLEVGHGVPELLDVLVVRQRRGFLAPRRRVSPVRLGRRPAVRQLHLRRQPEVPGGRLEDVPTHRGRDRQTLEVDEARGLEPVQDCVRRRLALRGGAVQEGGEVDELSFHSMQNGKSNHDQFRWLAMGYLVIPGSPIPHPSRLRPPFFFWLGQGISKGWDTVF